jgi:gamma-glutamyltranspeptidase/glutathione hydrolase
MELMLMQIFFRSLSVFYLIFFYYAPENTAALQDPVRGKNGIVVTASKIASDVGLEILKKGGNAVDAAVAVGFALAVTYPSAGNLGGGGFMVIHLSDGKNTTIDYREKAPGTSFETMYQDSSGAFIPELSQYGVTSSGVPGSVAGLIYALNKYGTLSLDEIIQPAIDLAENGFLIENRFAQSLEFELEEFNKVESTRKIFTKNGLAFSEGELLIQKDLAKTLKLISKFGLDGFYKGETAELIVKQINSDNGYISKNDLENYKPIEREPISIQYNGYKVITMGPPSGGGVSLLEMLNILENYNFTKEEWGSSNYIHALVESMKYSFADRSKYIGDPDFIDIPIDSILSEFYTKNIFSKIGSNAVPSLQILPGNFKSQYESEETTHYSIVDRFGNAVSTTTTINSSYGSKVVVDGAGFFLNNEMDDFSSKVGEPNQFGLLGSYANRIEPNKRMQSSMSPTIVLKDNIPVLIVGSPGGSTISTVVLQVILNVLNFGMDIQQAINKPRIHHQLMPDQIDYESFGLTADVKNSLIEMGHSIGNERSLGRVEGIYFDVMKKVFYGATDPRGYGKAAGY